MMPAHSCKGGAYEPGPNRKPETVDQRCGRPPEGMKDEGNFHCGFTSPTVKISASVGVSQLTHSQQLTDRDPALNGVTFNTVHCN